MFEPQGFKHLFFSSQKSRSAYKMKMLPKPTGSLQAKRRFLVTTRPDIVLLILDTQRADRLSCYGCPFETSPHIDTLAADSTFFHFAVSAAHWTVPSHTSMFTGLYPSSHNTLHASSVVPTSLSTLAERLVD